MSSLTRRFFVGSGLTIAAVGGTSLWACSAGQQAQSAHLDRLDILLADMVEPARVGKAFRRDLGQDRLHEAAAHNSHIVEALKHTCVSSRRDLLRQGVRDDFAQGRVVLCDRFVLSETECVVAGLRYDRALETTFART